MKKHLEIKTIEHKGIEVTLEVDYDRALVSLLEWSSFGSRWEKKEYVFANRGLEYMRPWLNILEAMTVAVKEGQRCLEQKLAEDSAFKTLSPKSKKN